MKKLLQKIFTLTAIAIVSTSCASRKDHSRQIAAKDSKPMGTVNAPDSMRTSNNLSIYPDANPASIPNPNPNPPSPNPPTR